MKTKLIVFSVLMTIVFLCSSNTIANNNSSKVGNEPGEKTYKKYCAACHGMDGKLGLNEASDLSKSKMTSKRRIKIIKEGKGFMLPFKNLLTEEEIKAVSDYTKSLRKK